MNSQLLDDTLQSKHSSEIIEASKDELEESSLPDAVINTLICALVVIYLCLWIVWLHSGEKLWQASVDLSIRLSAIRGGYLPAYCWFVSEVLYRWYFIIVAGLLVFSPRKDRAWTSITVFMASFWVRQLLRIFIHEPRPENSTTEIQENKCNCSFGMPSGHSEGIPLIYGLIFFNLMPVHSTVVHRVVFTTVATIICASVFFSRLYDGSHSFMQVSLGAAQGLLVFCTMLKFDKPMNRYFRSFLNHRLETVRQVWVLSGLASLSSLLLWYFYVDSMLKKLKIDAINCEKCFVDNNLKIRKDLGVAFMFPFLYFGIVVGSALLSQQYILNSSAVESYRKKIWTKKGMHRLLLTFLVHSPMTIYVVDVNPEWKVLLIATVNLGVGFLIGQLPKLFQMLGIDFQGDVVSWITADGIKF